jgi:hypothetical protein
LATWSVAVAAVGLDIAAALGLGVTSNAFLAVNNGVVALVVLGVANLWAQSGMRARHVAVLGGALALYDFIATSQLTLMTDLAHASPIRRSSPSGAGTSPVAGYPSAWATFFSRVLSHS